MSAEARPIVRTELTWTLEPSDFFEEPYRFEAPDYSLKVEGEKVTVTLSVPQRPVPDGLRERIDAEVRTALLLRQLLEHRSYKLRGPNISHYEEDGKRHIVAIAESAVIRISAGRADFVSRDSSGNVVRDSRAERIAQHTAYMAGLQVKILRSPTLTKLVESYAAAVADPANELLYLYEIRDHLKKHYDGEHKARHALGISESEWKRLGELANAEPLKEGRHRGIHASALRPATKTELEEARAIARKLIEAFAATV